MASDVTMGEDGHEELVLGDESEAYTLFSRGMELLDDHHPGQAAMLLGRAAQLEPAKMSIREGLARAEFALGRFEQAAEHFRLIVETAPDNDYAQYGLGRCLFKLGNPAKARAHLRLARALNPASAVYREAWEALAE